MVTWLNMKQEISSERMNGCSWPELSLEIKAAALCSVLPYHRHFTSPVGLGGFQFSKVINHALEFGQIYPHITAHCNLL